MAANESSALDGLRVLEVSASDSFASSLLAMLLADQGAAVVKVGVDEAHAPLEDARARTASREARARAGVDRGKRVIEPLVGASGVDQLAELADVVILPFDTAIPELGPDRLRARYPSLLVVTVCEFDALGERPPDDGTVGAATGLFTDMNIYDRIFEPGNVKYTMAPLPSTYAAVHGAAAVCLALLRRTATGDGDGIRVSLAGSFMQAQGLNLVSGWPGNKPVPGWFQKIASFGLQGWMARQAANGNEPFARKYDCADGPAMVQVLCSSSWKLPPRMLREMGLWDEAAKDVGIVDSDFGRNKKLGWRKKRGLTKLLEREFAKHTSEHWTGVLGPVVPVGAHRSTEAWFDLPFVRESGLRVDLDDPLVGAVGVPGRLVSVGDDLPIEPREIVADLDAVLATWREAAPFTVGTDGPLTGVGGLASGLRVLDLNSVVAAPYCTLTLAQYGAEVTRIAAPVPNHEDMIEFTAGADVQRGKQNIVVDLTTDTGQRRLADLVSESDVVVCNMRPQAASKLKVDANSIHALRPEAIYCRISAFPGSDWPGYDPLLQEASGVVDAYTRDSRSGLKNWLGLAGSVDYGGGASGLFAITLGLIRQARGNSPGASVAASLAHYAQLIQADHIITGEALPPIPQAPMPLSRTDDGAWWYSPATSGADATEAQRTVRITPLASLSAEATPITDAQVGIPCPPEFSAASVITQEQLDGTVDHHPAPTHVRFERADDPIIISAAALQNTDPDS